MAILGDVIQALGRSTYRISAHAADEMVADQLDEATVLRATVVGEVIEDYPSAFPFPACLVLGRSVTGDVVHTVWAYDPARCYAVLVTVYKPDPARWSPDFRTRSSR